MNKEENQKSNSILPLVRALLFHSFALKIRGSVSKIVCLLLQHERIYAEQIAFGKLVLILLSCTCMSPKARIEFSVSWMCLYLSTLRAAPCKGHSTMMGSGDGRDGAGWMEKALIA